RRNTGLLVEDGRRPAVVDLVRAGNRGEPEYLGPGDGVVALHRIAVRRDGCVVDPVVEVTGRAEVQPGARDRDATRQGGRRAARHGAGAAAGRRGRGTAAEDDGGCAAGHTAHREQGQSPDELHLVPPQCAARRAPCSHAFLTTTRATRGCRATRG